MSQTALAQATPPVDAFRQIRRDLARGGRPTSLTTDIIDALGDAISETAEYIEDACLAHGIPRRNYYNWLKQGERDHDQGLDTLASRFWHTLKTAEAQGLVNLGRLWVANPRDFASYATRQERRAPDKWARRQEEQTTPRVVVQIGVGGTDVKVGVINQTFASDTQALSLCKSELNGYCASDKLDYVNDKSLGTQDFVESGILAVGLEGDPTHPGGCAGGQPGRTQSKGAVPRSRPRKKKGDGAA